MKKCIYHPTAPCVKASSRLQFRSPSHALLRKFIFERDCFTCQLCGRKRQWPEAYYDGRYSYGNLNLDHRFPFWSGNGSHCVNNLQAVCESCNTIKGNIFDRRWHNYEATKKIIVNSCLSPIEYESQVKMLLDELGLWT